MSPLPRSSRQEFLAGLKAELPIALGGIPFGLIYGVLASATGLPPLLALAMSSVVFAGSAQFIGVQLMGVGTPGLIIVMTTFVVNLRHALYSTSLSPQMKHLPRRWQLLLAYLLTDEAYAMTIIRYLQDRRDEAPNKHYYFLATGLLLWVEWQISSAVGIFLGTQVPANWQLDFTLALTFIGLVIPTLKDKPHIASAATAGLVALLTYHWEYKLGLIAAALSGILIGVILENGLGINTDKRNTDLGESEQSPFHNS